MTKGLCNERVIELTLLDDHVISPTRVWVPRALGTPLGHPLGVHINPPSPPVCVPLPATGQSIVPDVPHVLALLWLDAAPHIRHHQKLLVERVVRGMVLEL